MKNVKIVLIFLLFIFLSGKLIAQAPIIQWQKTYGGSKREVAYSSCNIKEGGFAIVGNANSEDGNLTNILLPFDDGLWLIKLDSVGSIKFNRCYGGSASDEGHSIISTIDQGLIIAGSTSSNDGDVSGLHGFHSVDDWVVKIDSTGIIQWQKCLGSSEYDEAYEIIQTSDSGFLVTGYVSWGDGDVIGFHGEEDMFVVKLNKNGVKQWAKSLGGSDFDWGSSCIQAKDGGYLIAGSTASINGDASGQHGTGVDAWVVKLNSIGQIEWQRCYGGTAIENANKIILTSDGGFFLSATTGSSNGDLTDYHGGIDYWLIKADSFGNIEWQKCYGGTAYQSAYSANSTSDGGVVMIGTTYSNDSIVTGTHGLFDYWVCKIDSVGTFQWGKSLGGSDDDYPYSIHETPDGGFLAAGSTLSTDGNITSNHGDKDFWIVKLGPLGLSVPEIENTLMELSIFQNNDRLNLKFFSKKNESAQLCLYDINGKKVFEKSILVNEGINYNSFSCSGFARGMYFVKIDCDKGLLGGKIILQSEL